MRPTTLTTLFTIVALACSVPQVRSDDSLVRTSDPLTPQAELAALSVPDGFEIQLFAAEPHINKPINLAYDKRGRIWVSSTVEYPYAAARERWSDAEGTRVRDSRDAIKILEDTDGDGRADKFTDFADGLNIPTGVLPWHQPGHHDGCIAWSIPNIWYFADTTGDGMADHREVLFGPLGYERDTHGMCSSFTMGRDGWVYATHGFNNTSRLRARDGTEIELHSGNVFRFRPDGSSVEVYTRGQVNPFGLTFDRRGNLYSADCHSAPVYQLLHGATYPSFGKPHDGLGFAPTMIEHTHGSTGICGITYIDRNQWGETWNDHLLIGNPVTSKVNHDRIEFRGTTPVAVEQPDFVTSEDPWFRPVDLCLGGDGALYVADFYNRIIGHYEVPLDHPGRDRERGRIWRIIRTEKNPTPPPIAPAVEQIADPTAALSDSSPFVRRRAAHQLQFAPQIGAVAHLVKALQETPAEDTHLRHVLRLSLRAQLTAFPAAFAPPTGLAAGHEDVLADIAPAVPNAGAANFLASHATMRAAHLTHIARHADRSVLADLIRELDGSGTLEQQLERIDLLQAGLDERGQLEPQPELVAWAQALARRLLAAVDATEGDWLPLPHPASPNSAAPWAHQPRECADGKQAKVLSSLRIGEGEVEQRTGVLLSKEFPAPVRLVFWIVGHRGYPDNDPHTQNYVSLVDDAGAELHRAYPPRSDIAEEVTWNSPEGAVGRPVRFKIVDGDSGNAYAWLGLTRIGGSDAISTDTFRRAGSDRESLAQLADLLKLSAPIDLRDQLRPYLPAALEQLRPRATTPAERQRLDKLVASRAAGFAAANDLDPERGAAVFAQHCAACHQVGGEGGLIGPQLDGIGTRGIGRLCEDILDPNRNVDSHFYLTQFHLEDGSQLGAFVLSERGQALQVRDLAGTTRRLAKSSISSRETLPTSLMPTTFSSAISVGEFYDLIAWLSETKD